MIGIFTILMSTIITAILFFASKINNPRNIEGLMLLTQVSALGASILMSWNFILATRLKVIEKMFSGLDNVYKIHNLLGNIAFILAVHHPIFLIISSLPYNATKLYLMPSLKNIPYALGIIALYLLIIFVCLTIFVDLPYKLWKKTHEFIGVVIVLGSLHSILVSSDISFYLPLKIWVIGINILAITAYLYKRFGYYLYIPKNNYSVVNITRDNDYMMIDLQAQDLNNNLSFKPGQFAFVSLENDKRDDHPFSVLDQNGLNLKLGIKIVGPFTLSLSNLKSGDKINVFGPYGHFSEGLERAKKVLFISGGIGITPFYSMLKVLDKGSKAYMIHSKKENEPNLFTKLFLSIKENNAFQFILHNSEKDGRLNLQKINDYVQLDQDFYVYICGPTSMMHDLSNELVNFGILQKRIIFEDFNFK